MALLPNDAKSTFTVSRHNPPHSSPRLRATDLPSFSVYAINQTQAFEKVKNPKISRELLKLHLHQITSLPASSESLPLAVPGTQNFIPEAAKSLHAGSNLYDGFRDLARVTRVGSRFCAACAMICMPPHPPTIAAAHGSHDRSRVRAPTPTSQHSPS